LILNAAEWSSTLGLLLGPQFTTEHPQMVLHDRNHSGLLPEGSQKGLGHHKMCLS
jgi:hypothetical protein